MRVRRNTVAVREFEPEDKRPFFGWVPLQNRNHGALRDGRRALLPLDLVGGVDFQFVHLFRERSRRFTPHRRENNDKGDCGHSNGRNSKMHGNAPRWATLPSYDLAIRRLYKGSRPIASGRPAVARPKTNRGPVLFQGGRFAVDARDQSVPLASPALTSFPTATPPSALIAASA